MFKYLLPLFLIGCYAEPQELSVSCQPYVCPNADRGAKLCCEIAPCDDVEYEGEEELSCWYRADGRDFHNVNKFMEFCYPTGFEY